MESLPRKQTLPELVIARLREGITEGEWEGALPAERALSEKLEVSRSTLRLAISQLKDEGWLTVVGKRTMIVKRRRRTGRTGALKKRRIVFLSPSPLEQLPSMVLFVYGELIRRLGSLDASIQIETSPAFSHRKVEGYLDKLASGSRADAWVFRQHESGANDCQNQL